MIGCLFGHKPNIDIMMIDVARFEQFTGSICGRCGVLYFKKVRYSVNRTSPLTIGIGARILIGKTWYSLPLEENE